MKRGTLGAKTGSGLYDWPPETLEKIRQSRENLLIEWMKKDAGLFDGMSNITV